MSQRAAGVMDAPSPSPSNMPPPGNANTNKRPRPSGPGAGASRSKRAKKVEEPAVGSDDEVDVGKKGHQGEDGEIHTKIDFRDLPDETLFKYLEAHSLLPVWRTSPWSEEPMQRPSELYPKDPESSVHNNPAPRRSDSGLGASSTRVQETGVSEPAKADAEADVVDADDPDGVRATRSKTAPQRKEATPAVAPSNEVVTLSDVHAAREVLAEKANQHWAKGLGGGQNKESETIVQFLYKLKVGPDKLLRVYNPNPINFTSRV